MTTRGHDEQVENIGAYALGALPELDAQVFERHLMGCTTCQDELQRLHEAADALPRSVTPYSPPPSLKQSLMETVREDAARARPEPERREPRRSWLPRLSLRPALATAAAALLVAIAVYGLARDPGGGDSRTVAVQVDERVIPSGSAKLVIPDGEEDATLHVKGLPDPGPGRVYEVWVQRGDDVVPVSIFSVDSDGDGAAAVPGSLSDAKAVMVTRERRGGAQAPTEMPLLSAEV